jgi:hypothetical protein
MLGVRWEGAGLAWRVYHGMVLTTYNIYLVYFLARARHPAFPSEESVRENQNLSPLLHLCCFVSVQRLWESELGNHTMKYHNISQLDFWQPPIY